MITAVETFNLAKSLSFPSRNDNLFLRTNTWIMTAAAAVKLRLWRIYLIEICFVKTKVLFLVCKDREFWINASVYSILVPSSCEAGLWTSNSYYFWMRMHISCRIKLLKSGATYNSSGFNCNYKNKNLNIRNIEFSLIIS